jgi:catabolite regulation protein CreA
MDIVAKHQNICRLFCEQPPDVVVVEQDSSEGYAFHERTSLMWKFICVMRHYVNKWMAAENEQTFKLVFEAIFKRAFEHTLAKYSCVYHLEGLK